MPMTRKELVGLTLDQLLLNFSTSPECFDLEFLDVRSFTVSASEAIMWKHRVEVDSGSYIPDPNNPTRTIVVIHNKSTHRMTCNIYFRDMINIANTASHTAEATCEAKLGFFVTFDSNYKKFNKLKSLIVKHSRAKESNTFLSKLHAVFPGTFDEYIFGKK
jgi:hypothetical protein